MLTAAHRARRREIGDDDGFTLIELLVTVIIASIVGAGALSWFLGASNATTTTTDVDNATASARNVLQTWGKMLQLAGSTAGVGTTTNGVQSLSPSAITFTAYLSNSGACSAGSSCTPLAASAVTLTLTGGLLTEAVGSNHSSVVESSTTTAADPSGCLFTAYTATGLLGCSSALTTTQLASITSIVLAFKVVTASGSTRSFQTTAAFTN
jgi:prepilin-type N-terminal cleavage/methylation domain-containing protein